MHILIGEQEQKIAESIQSYIVQAVKNICPSETFVLKTLNTKFSILDYIEQQTVDLLFLDTELGVENGICLAEEIQNRNNKIKIVFISKEKEHIEEIFCINPFYFLFLPTTLNKVEAVIKKAVSVIKEEDRNVITVKNKDGVFLLHLYDILYIQCEKRYLHIFTQNMGDVKIIMTMAEMEEKLKGRLFRCHRSYFINLGKVQCFQNGYVKMMNQKEISVSAGKYKELEKCMEKMMLV